MPLKIIYLDDEADLCEMFKENMESPEVQIWTFTDPKDLFKQVEAIQPDLVFLDYRLPNTNGDLVAARLDPSIPKVMITGDFDVEPQSNFQKILQKPFSFSELESYILEQLKRKLGA